MVNDTPTILLRDGPLGTRVEPWLRSKEGVKVVTATNRKISKDRHESKSSMTVDEILKSDPRLLLSAGYRHIVPRCVLEEIEITLNCHTSYLPYARGANSNVWSIIEDGPVGVTIHEMIQEVDAGPLVAQRYVPVYPDDNGRSLYIRLIDATVGLLQDEWLAIREGTYDTTNNPIEHGSYHKSSEFQNLCEIDLELEAPVADVIDKLRALTFPPFKNAYFERDGTRYYVDINIRREEDLSDSIQSARKTDE